MEAEATTELTGLALAVNRMGGQKALAAALEVSAQAVSKWVKVGHAPLERVADIEALTKVPKLDLVDQRLRDFVVSASQPAAVQRESVESEAQQAV